MSATEQFHLRFYSPLAETRPPANTVSQYRTRSEQSCFVMAIKFLGVKELPKFFWTTYCYHLVAACPLLAELHVATSLDGPALEAQ
jgi:hypothetical protein